MTALLLFLLLNAFRQQIYTMKCVLRDNTILNCTDIVVNSVNSNTSNKTAWFYVVGNCDTSEYLGSYIKNILIYDEYDELLYNASTNYKIEKPDTKVKVQLIGSYQYD